MIFLGHDVRKDVWMERCHPPKVRLWGWWMVQLTWLIGPSQLCINYKALFAMNMK